MNQRGYTVSSSIRGRIRTLERKGDKVYSISFQLMKGDQPLAVWQSAPEDVTTKLRRHYTQNPDSDKVLVDFVDAMLNSLLETEYDLYETPKESDLPEKQPLFKVQNLGKLEHIPEQYRPLYQTLGKVDKLPDGLGALIHEKVQELRQKDELEELRVKHDELRARNEDLQEKAEELEAQVEAKSNLEYYSKLAGDVLPGIAKALEKTSLGPALSGLAGEPTDKDDQTTVLESAKALITALDDEKLSAFYMLVLEFQNNPDLIPAIYQNAFSNETAD